MIEDGIRTGLPALAREEALEAGWNSPPGGARRKGGVSPVCGIRAERRRGPVRELLPSRSGAGREEGSQAA
jgi:hypothetical protein